MAAAILFMPRSIAASDSRRPTGSGRYRLIKRGISRTNKLIAVPPLGAKSRRTDWQGLDQQRNQSWSRLSEQILRVDNWSVCRVRPPTRNDGSLKISTDRVARPVGMLASNAITISMDVPNLW
ncbi:hypothetical protein RX330_11875 [Bradyrhizobium sp. NDS-1]|uniref:hypothetical protein n=1 Tax=Bradyrhizobium sp. NDS-1 TaxID=3080014 RepID=UPI00293F35FC|nr:hypothetical protein [Bradyrhizobium sp. NDS-1]WOH75719.1 hypothetical protein RX330_11875 [Bradyrhizobium sp. NDS-1]